MASESPQKLVEGAAYNLPQIAEALCPNIHYPTFRRLMDEQKRGYIAQLIFEALPGFLQVEGIKDFIGRNLISILARIKILKDEESCCPESFSEPIYTRFEG